MPHLLSPKVKQDREAKANQKQGEKEKSAEAKAAATQAVRGPGEVRAFSQPQPSMSPEQILVMMQQTGAHGLQGIRRLQPLPPPSSSSLVPLPGGFPPAPVAIPSSLFSPGTAAVTSGSLMLRLQSLPPQASPSAALCSWLAGAGKLRGALEKQDDGDEVRACI